MSYHEDATPVSLVTGYAVTLAGIVMDGGTFLVHEIEDWGSPELRLQTEPRVGQDGSWSGTGFWDSLTLLVQGRIKAPTRAGREAAEDRLRTALPKNVLVGLTIHRDTGNRTVLCRVLKLKVGTESATRVTFSVSLRADDPHVYAGSGSDIYDWDWLSAMTGLPASTGGLPIPVPVPLTFEGTSVSGELVMDNPAPHALVQVTINGPCTGPVLTWANSVGQGGTVAWPSLTLGDGEFIQVSNVGPAGEARWSSLLQGQSPRWPSPAQWPTPAGQTTFRFNAASGTAAASMRVRLLPGYGG